MLNAEEWFLNIPSFSEMCFSAKNILKVKSDRVLDVSRPRPLFLNKVTQITCSWSFALKEQVA